ncbi:FtsX-like permease family protein [Lacticaseibacillus brantae]|uniref:Abc transporter permease n=1 Tax=Lacticaseibacillus brantae DSM 23927 TaxID=1423727 RepID=A0A0R2B0A4_9LACO|nr:FtsX-like permease family protein [Lacticaseibacillus brantae]KRM72210.1 abc transporter permease [Lacticaseibacillus brantae DSM 23927]
MLNKLALGGIRSRFRDYAVLFSGLVISGAIFYMFMALATNSEFIAKNAPVTGANFIFMFGAVLLAIITLVYIVYANTFLMSMRQRDYAMFIMLGAKSNKIGQLIFLETVLIGLMATAVGVIVGIGLTVVTANILMAQLHAPLIGFSGFYLPAVLSTFAFFIVLFVIAAFFNQRRLLKTPILQLLHADQTPNRIKQKRIWFIIQIVGAVVLLAIGYAAMIYIKFFQLLAIPLALVTIVAGTYFLFNSLFVGLIALLKRQERFANKGIRMFTLSQLSFRIRDYTKILSVVAMLFALALGAITIGIGFNHEIPLMASSQSKYDVVLHNPSTNLIRQAEGLTDATKVSYNQKIVGENVYYVDTQVKAHPFLVPKVTGLGESTTRTLNAGAINKDDGSAAMALNEFIPNAREVKTPKVVSAAVFASLKGQTNTIVTYRVPDFVQQYDRIKALVAADDKANKVNTSIPMMNSKFTAYEVINGMFSGLEFMGFFLGLAFLAMLASTLMFKILSGAAYDKSRYLMLQKVGVRPGLLRKSIRQEIGALFLLPGLVGVVHVLFGLQLFRTLMANPYDRIWIPFTIFIVLYALYYGLTVWLYQSIVINKQLAAK